MKNENVRELINNLNAEENYYNKPNPRRIYFNADLILIRKTAPLHVTEVIRLFLFSEIQNLLAC